MSTQKMAEIFQRLSEESDGLTSQLDKAISTSRKLYRVVGKLTEHVKGRVNNVEAWEKSK